MDSDITSFLIGTAVGSALGFVSYKVFLAEREKNKAFQNGKLSMEKEI